MPVGKGIKLEPFQLKEVKYSSGDLLCLYTDGYADQFGGPDSHRGGKKFKYKALNELLTRSKSQGSEKIKEHLKVTFENWKGKLEQIDDVLVIGIKL